MTGAAATHLVFGSAANSGQHDSSLAAAHRRQIGFVVLGKRRGAKPTPPPWKGRVDRARQLILSYDSSELTELRLAEIETALLQASRDKERLTDALAQLDPDRVAAELKEALRSRSDPTVPDTPVITTLRRRYESVHTLQDRLVSLENRIEVSLVDIEACAAAIIDSSLRAGGGAAARTHLDALHADAVALAAAHDEVAAI